MATEKDKIIDQLFEVIQTKKSEIEKTEKAKWQTNCSFAYDSDSNKRYNIQTVNDINQIVDMLAHLIINRDSITIAAKTLGVNPKFEWMGFSFEQWEADFKTRVEKIQIFAKKQELKTLEDRLDKLVSKEKREELELAAIKKELGVK